MFVSADVGGYLGLFLGCSILTVFEFIDLALVFFFGRLGRNEDNENSTHHSGGNTNADQDIISNFDIKETDLDSQL